jgi:hypothetical protein
MSIECSGPHWQVGPGGTHSSVMVAAATLPDENLARKAEAYFAANEMSLDEIESVALTDVEEFQP